ncbi:MAG: YdeI/OmpD-associated family protein [Saprospiraceae bacterium]|nr:YdeI/OmpD-associated family protein [Saprospiraceae bacterium]
MGNGELFFSVNSVVRKAIKKQDGDTVHLILYRVTDIQTIPDEVIDCLKEDPEALGAFNLWTESQKLEFVRYVYDAKTETQKAERLVELLERLHQSY